MTVETAGTEDRSGGVTGSVTGRSSSVGVVGGAVEEVGAVVGATGEGDDDASVPDDTVLRATGTGATVCGADSLFCRISGVGIAAPRWCVVRAPTSTRACRATGVAGLRTVAPRRGVASSMRTGAGPPTSWLGLKTPELNANQLQASSIKLLAAIAPTTGRVPKAHSRSPTDGTRSRFETSSVMAAVVSIYFGSAIAASAQGVLPLGRKRGAEAAGFIGEGRAGCFISDMRQPRPFVNHSGNRDTDPPIRDIGM